MKDVVVLGGARTAFGTYGGALRDTSATDLGVIASKGALERFRIEFERVGGVYHRVATVAEAPEVIVGIAREREARTAIAWHPSALGTDWRETLTAREHEVLQLMGCGLDNRAMADQLTVSQTTVRGYVRNILRALDAHSRLEAVVRASDLGLL